MSIISKQKVWAFAKIGRFYTTKQGMTQKCHPGIFVNRIVTLILPLCFGLDYSCVIESSALGANSATQLVFSALAKLKSGLFELGVA